MHKSKSAASRYENKFGPDPQWAYCPFCNQGIYTEVKYNATAATHIIASILCALGCWLCFWIPYVLKNFNIARHYCPICVHHIGSYNPRTKIATSTIDHRFRPTIATPAFIRHSHLAHRKKQKLKSKRHDSITVKISDPLKIHSKKHKSQSQQTKNEKVPQKIYRDVSICTHMYKNVGTESQNLKSNPRKCTSLSFGQYTQTCDRNLKKMSEKSLTANVPQVYEASIRSRFELLLSKLISSEKFLHACSFGSTQVLHPPKKAIGQSEKATSTMNYFSNFFQSQKVNSEHSLKPNRKYRSKSDYSKFSDIVDGTHKNKSDLRRRPKSKITITVSDAEPKKSYRKLKIQPQTIDTQTESKMFDHKRNFETDFNAAEIAVVLNKAFQNKLRFQKKMTLPKKVNDYHEKIQTLKFSQKLCPKSLGEGNNNDGCESSFGSSEFGASEPEQDIFISDGSSRVQHLRGGASKTAAEEPKIEVLASFDKKFRKSSQLRKPQTYSTSLKSA